MSDVLVLISTHKLSIVFSPHLAEEGRERAAGGTHQGAESAHHAHGSRWGAGAVPDCTEGTF